MMKRKEDTWCIGLLKTGSHEARAEGEGLGVERNGHGIIGKTMIIGLSGESPRLGDQVKKT